MSVAEAFNPGWRMALLEIISVSALGRCPGKPLFWVNGGAGVWVAAVRLSGVVGVCAAELFDAVDEPAALSASDPVVVLGFKLICAAAACWSAGVLGVIALSLDEAVDCIGPDAFARSAGIFVVSSVIVWWVFVLFALCIMAAIVMASGGGAAGVPDDALVSVAVALALSCALVWSGLAGAVNEFVEVVVDLVSTFVGTEVCRVFVVLLTLSMSSATIEARDTGVILSDCAAADDLDAAVFPDCSSAGSADAAVALRC